MGTLWMTVLVPLAFVAILVWRVVRRGYQMKDLVERGRPVTGEVVNKVKFRGSSSVRNRYLRYRFRAGDGKYYSHKIAVGAGDYNALEPGDPIDLVYLPDRPAVSATAQMVETVRAAMAERDAKKAAGG